MLQRGAIPHGSCAKRRRRSARRAHVSNQGDRGRRWWPSSFETAAAQPPQDEGRCCSGERFLMGPARSAGGGAPAGPTSRTRGIAGGGGGLHPSRRLLRSLLRMRGDAAAGSDSSWVLREAQAEERQQGPRLEPGGSRAAVVAFILRDGCCAASSG